MSAAAPAAEARTDRDHRGADELFAHVAMIHRMAQRAGKPGKLVVCCFGEHPETGKKTSPLVRHFAIGDVEGMAAAVRQLGAERDRNVYVPLAVMRPGLAKGLKGQESDVVAVLGLVPDFDDEAAADYEARLPLPPSLVLETSAGRFQTPYLLDEPATVVEAKPVAEALKALARCDHGTADLSHVWRVPGTLNWPTRKKLAEGRPREPQRVRVAQPWDGSLVSLAELREAIELAREDDGDDWDAGPEPEPEGARHGPNGRANGHDAGDPDFTVFLMSLPKGLRRRIVEPSADRSKAMHFVVQALLERGVALDRIEALIRAHPAGVGEKYAARTDLRKEIERIRRKWRARGGTASAGGESDPAPAQVDVAELARLECSDTGNARRLLARFGRDLLFPAHAGWHAWDGRRFVRDECQVAVKHAQQTAKGIFEECEHLADQEAQKARAKWAVSSQNQNRVNGMLAMAAPHLALLPDQLDADPWFLNVANGTLDLRTGGLRPHRRGDRLTKLAPVAYDPKATAPTWTRFLGEILAGDEELVGFVRRAFGYSLTGDTSEQVIIVEHGGGSNGKSTKLEVLAALLGDYGQMTPTETFLAKDRGGGIPNDVARLRGARFVSAVETGSGRRLDEGLVKQVTGGDRMAARFLHREWFEFSPQFKLWLATNHKPEIRGTDHAVWRRIRLIPFEVKFWRANEPGRPEGAPVVDRRLRAKLLAELPGVLAWAVRGCLEWQREGLKEPARVLAATAAYRAEMDRLSDFLADQCEVDPNLSAKASELYGGYRSWCQRNGEEPQSQTWFGRELGDRGFSKEKAGIVVYRGLRLRPAE